MTDLCIAEVRYAPCSSADQATGMLGYLSLTLNGALRLDGLALRRTLVGNLTIAYPARTDSAGKRHAYIRPIDNASRRAITTAVLAALGMDGAAAATPANRQAESAP